MMLSAQNPSPVLCTHHPLLQGHCRPAPFDQESPEPTTAVALATKESIDPPT